jgi:hypothetical protein
MARQGITFEGPVSGLGLAAADNEQAARPGGNRLARNFRQPFHEPSFQRRDRRLGPILPDSAARLGALAADFRLDPIFLLTNRTSRYSLSCELPELLISGAWLCHR